MNPLLFLFCEMGRSFQLGCLWSREFILRSMQERLARFSEHILSNLESSADEARLALQKLNSFSYPACSDAELEAFRRVAYASHYLKDAGRLADGKIQCSAMLGRPRRAEAGLGTDFPRPDGTRVYSDMEPYRIPGETVVGVQSGNALVVYSPYNLRVFQSQPMHFFVSDRDLSTGQTRYLAGNGSTALHSQQVFTAPVMARYGGVLYATRCTTRYATCITAYMTVPEALQSEQGQYRIYIGLSMLCGALLGLTISLLYRRSRSIEQQLRRAIRGGRLGVEYQPIFDLRSGRAIAAEALARWTDEDGFSVSPEIFIKVAEDRGFVEEITRFMVRQTLQALSRISAIQPDFRINVNIAPADLNDPNFLPMLGEALDWSQVPAHCLGFEITESTWAHWDAAHDVLLALRRREHLVHIDDFGKGYSSLAYLNTLPVDVLKIDKEFTQSIGTQSVKISIVPQILDMASSLNLQVIVEGIETEEQAQYYAGWTPPVLGQGWYFGRPMSLENLLQLLRGGGPPKV